MSDFTHQIPVIGFCAYSGTGKTTLITKLIPKLRARKIRLAVIKHAHHNFDIDHPGKDSYRFKQAGANQILISSAKRIALITELEEDDQEATLQQLLDQLDKSKLDLILVEGFKKEAFDKIELHREELNKPYMFETDENVIAVASDHKIDTKLPKLDINDPMQIVEFIIGKCLSCKPTP